MTPDPTFDCEIVDAEGNPIEAIPLSDDDADFLAQQFAPLTKGG